MGTQNMQHPCSRISQAGNVEELFSGRGLSAAALVLQTACPRQSSMKDCRHAAAIELACQHVVALETCGRGASRHRQTLCPNLGQQIGPTFFSMLNPAFPTPNVPFLCHDSSTLVILLLADLQESGMPGSEVRSLPAGSSPPLYQQLCAQVPVG